MKQIGVVPIVVLMMITNALGAGSPPAQTTASPDVVAVVPPTAVLIGRVMLKDGVTPVARAEILMTGAVDDEPRLARSNRSGRFKIHLPAGHYSLQITRRMEIYQAHDVYRVPGGGRLDIDFLLLPDFEKGPGAADVRPPVGRGPDPVPTSPAVVGSVVDMVRSHTTRRLGRWAEALGFLGSLLAVGLAAD